MVNELLIELLFHRTHRRLFTRTWVLVYSAVHLVTVTSHVTRDINVTHGLGDD